MNTHQWTAQGGTSFLCFIDKTLRRNDLRQLKSHYTQICPQRSIGMIGQGWKIAFLADEIFAPSHIHTK